MSDRTEYWWVRYHDEIQPAEVGFRGGIPAQVWFIGASESVPAASADLVERLPAPPRPIFQKPETPPAPRRSNLLFLILSIALLVILFRCAGLLYDAMM